MLKGSEINHDLRLKIENHGISTLTDKELKNLNLIKIEEGKNRFQNTMETLICTIKKAIF